MKKFSDREIVEGISGGCSKALEHVYKEVRPLVVRKVVEAGGTTDQAKDIFQVVIIDLFLRLKREKKEIHNVKSYLTKASMREYLKKQDASGTEVRTEDLDYIDEHCDEYHQVDQFPVRFMNSFKMLPGDCRRLLWLRSYGLSFDRIAGEMKMTGSNAVRQKKDRCIKMLISIIRKTE